MTKDKTLGVISKGTKVGEIADTGSPIGNAEKAIEILKREGLFAEQSQSKLMFRQARSFSKISRDIHQASLLVPPYNPEACAPFVVNAAFASEMYLKTLLSLSDQSKNTHTLSSLFKLLPNKLKDQINKITKDKSAVFQVEASLFKDHLKTINNAFVDWRYIYEHKQATVNINKILLILTVLDTLACNEVQKT
ncbi:hypothetical protein EZV61_09270 [Corallincola luteus]|uniref:HEPN domain-containing protein n=1 Tax=Corallincola luteus TaxID=1775177 RepID=A0ABY2APQ1_9GAMM|nr:hypothetical protein [Corallincola luteus]TCI03720.1 hypothetical protein EZV61_09270 [Corallincola luteus]